jgi:hypothetical protein
VRYRVLRKYIISALHHLSCPPLIIPAAPNYAEWMLNHKALASHTLQNTPHPNCSIISAHALTLHKPHKKKTRTRWIFDLKIRHIPHSDFAKSDACPICCPTHACYVSCLAMAGDCHWSACLFFVFFVLLLRLWFACFHFLDIYLLLLPGSIPESVASWFVLWLSFKTKKSYHHLGTSFSADTINLIYDGTTMSY